MSEEKNGHAVPANRPGSDEETPRRPGFGQSRSGDFNVEIPTMTDIPMEVDVVTPDTIICDNCGHDDDDVKTVFCTQCGMALSNSQSPAELASATDLGPPKTSPGVGVRDSSKKYPPTQAVAEALSGDPEPPLAPEKEQPPKETIEVVRSNSDNKIVARQDNIPDAATVLDEVEDAEATPPSTDSGEIDRLKLELEEMADAQRWQEFSDQIVLEMLGKEQPLGNVGDLSDDEERAIDEETLRAAIAKLKREKAAEKARAKAAQDENGQPETEPAKVDPDSSESKPSTEKLTDRAAEIAKKALASIPRLQPGGKVSNIAPAYKPKPDDASVNFDYRVGNLGEDEDSKIRPKPDIPAPVPAAPPVPAAKEKVEEPPAPTPLPANPDQRPAEPTSEKTPSVKPPEIPPKVTPPSAEGVTVPKVVAKLDAEDAAAAAQANQPKAAPYIRQPQLSPEDPIKSIPTLETKKDQPKSSKMVWMVGLAALIFTGVLFALTLQLLPPKSEPVASLDILPAKTSDIAPSAGVEETVTSETTEETEITFEVDAGFNQPDADEIAKVEVTPEETKTTEAPSPAPDQAPAAPITCNGWNPEKKQPGLFFKKGTFMQVVKCSDDSTYAVKRIKTPSGEMQDEFLPYR